MNSKDKFIRYFYHLLKNRVFLLKIYTCIIEYQKIQNKRN